MAKLATRVFGPEAGHTILFVHAVGVSSWMWEPVIGHLPDMRCILVDLPGHGGSRDIPWRGIPDAARQVREAAGDAPCHLAGISLGAYVGLEILCQTPAAFRTAMLSGMHPGGMPNPLMTKLVSTLVAPLAVRPGFARRTAAQLGLPEEDRTRFAKDAARTRARAFRRATLDVIDYALPPVEEVQTDVLVCAGSREHPVIREGLSTITDALPMARALLVDNLGHGWSGEAPELFANTLRAHIEGGASRSAAQ